MTGTGVELGVLPNLTEALAKWLGVPLHRKPLQQILQPHPLWLPPIEDRLHDVRREERQPQHPAHVYPRLTFSRCASSSIVPQTPSSSIRRHRNARASALTVAVSTIGRGAHVAE